MTRAATIAARALARLARGVPKTYTDEEKAKRRARLAEVRKRRWPDKTKTVVK